MIISKEWTMKNEGKAYRAGGLRMDEKTVGSLIDWEKGVEAPGVEDEITIMAIAAHVSVQIRDACKTGYVSSQLADQLFDTSVLINRVFLRRHELIFGVELCSILRSIVCMLDLEKNLEKPAIDTAGIWTAEKLSQDTIESCFYDYHLDFIKSSWLAVSYFQKKMTNTAEASYLEEMGYEGEIASAIEALIEVDQF